MRWRRFFLLLTVAWVLTICLACDQISSSRLDSPISSGIAEAQPSVVSPASSPLPAATQAVLAGRSLYNPPRGNVRLAVISDLNSAYGSTDYEPEVDSGINLLPFWQPDLVLCSGDMVAGQKPSLTPAQIQAMWAGFDQHVAAPLRQYGLPFGFTVGNHDASSAQAINGGFLFQQERDLASQYWNRPEHNPGVQFVDRYQFPFYYSFAAQDIFFLVWDGSSSRIPADQLAWVEQALSSPAARQAKLRILIGHLPLYGVAVGRDEPGEVMDNADSLRALLEKYSVHTYISGHHHAYYPAHKGRIQFLHTGILGSGPRPLIAGTAAPRKTLTIIDVQFDSPDLTTYTTYDMQTLQPIQFDELPRSLTAHNGLLLRRDVSDLKASERRLCEQKLSTDLCRA
ncbi:MAG: metallophosphoesterase family protein [Elainella sp.]